MEPAPVLEEASLAWVHEPVREGLPEPQGRGQEAQGHAPPRQHQPHKKSQLWLEQWQALSQREAIAASEVASCLNRDIIPAKCLTLSEAEQAAASQVPSLPQLRRKAWGQVTAAKDAVQQVQQQLAQVENTPAFVASLTASIDQADKALGSFHAWNGPALATLEQQAHQLEYEVYHAALLIEEDQLSGDGCVVMHTSSQPHTHKAQHTSSQSHDHTAQRVGGARRSEAVSAPGSRRTTCDTSSSKRSGHPAPRRRITSPHTTTYRPPEPSFLTHQPSTTSCGTMRRSSVTGSAHSQGCLAPEVVAYDEFMLQHGEWGGWDEDDHKEFESILKACGSDYVKAVEVALEQCVGFTRAELMQHARWHMDYTDLLLRKRMAVTAWRVHKDKLKAQAQAKAALLAPEPSQAPSVEARAAAAAAARVAAAASRETAVKKELVQSWKQRREDAARQAAERAAQAARQEAERKSLEVAERQHLNKMRIQLHRDLKARVAEDAARRAAAAAEQEQVLKAMSSNQVAASVAQRNQSLLVRRQGLVEMKRVQAQQREQVQQQLLEKVRVEAPADPKRLLKGTAAHMARVAETRQEERAARDSGFILQVAHRQQASWRAGLQSSR